MKFITTIDEAALEMEFSPSMDNIRVLQNNSEQKIDCVALSSNSFSLILNSHTYYLTITPQLDGYEVTVDNYTHFVQIKDELELLLEKNGQDSTNYSHSNKIHAPIPGLVSNIFVTSGDAVQTGDKLCILEAMKMENEIITPKNGTITHLYIDSGTSVEKGDLLMEVSD